MTLRFRDLVWELVERKDPEDIHNAEIPGFVFRVADFMKGQTQWTGTASDLLAAMAEKNVSPNMVKKYLGPFAGEVLAPEGVRYQTKRTGNEDYRTPCPVPA